VFTNVSTGVGGRQLPLIRPIAVKDEIIQMARARVLRFMASPLKTRSRDLRNDELDGNQTHTLHTALGHRA